MQINNIKYYFCTISVLIMMIGLLMWRTDGFSSYTYESNRRSSIQDKPVEVSDWKLQNSRNEMTSLSSFEEGLLLVDFIYTRCPTVCRALGSRYSQLQTLIDANPSSDIKLLSISIDPEFDTPSRLKLYQQAHKGNEESWDLARPINQITLDNILKETGVRVIPDEIWGFAHSDSIHVIQNGLLTSIKNWDSSDLDSLIQRNLKLEPSS